MNEGYRDGKRKKKLKVQFQSEPQPSFDIMLMISLIFSPFNPHGCQSCIWWAHIFLIPPLDDDTFPSSESVTFYSWSSLATCITNWPSSFYILFLHCSWTVWYFPLGTVRQALAFLCLWYYLLCGGHWPHSLKYLESLLGLSNIFTRLSTGVHLESLQ